MTVWRCPECRKTVKVPKDYFTAGEVLTCSLGHDLVDMVPVEASAE